MLGGEDRCRNRWIPPVVSPLGEEIGGRENGDYCRCTTDGNDDQGFLDSRSPLPGPAGPPNAQSVAAAQSAVSG